MPRFRIGVAVVVALLAAALPTLPAHAATLTPLSVNCGSGGSGYPPGRTARVGDTVAVTNTSGSATCDSVGIWVVATTGAATWTSSAAPGTDPTSMGPGDVFTITFTQVGNVAFNFRNTTLPGNTVPYWTVSAALPPEPAVAQDPAPAQLLGLEQFGATCPERWGASWAAWARRGQGGDVCVSLVPSATVASWSAQEREAFIARASRWLGATPR